MAGVPPGIDLPALEAYFAGNVEGGGGALEVELLSGGRSNLTYLVRSAGRDWVLRRPPLGNVLPTAHDMAREFRVLSGLAGTDVPAPRPLALCEDRSVLGEPFYVMEYCRGLILGENAIHSGAVPTEGARRQLSINLVDALVRLHAVDYEAVGLSDFGRPEGYVERQIRRWTQQWERSKTRDLPEIYELTRRLNLALPESPAPTIVHGDFRLGNSVVSEELEIVALLDWEMSTLGDPLTDVGWWLTHWAEEDRSRFSNQPGFLSPEELVEEYARRSGRSVANIDFYHAFQLFKEAVIVEGIHARFLAGNTVGAGFDQYDLSPGLVARALAICEASTDVRLHA